MSLTCVFATLLHTSPSAPSCSNAESGGTGADISISEGEATLCTLSLPQVSGFLSWSWTGHYAVYTFHFNKYDSLLELRIEKGTHWGWLTLEWASYN